jgi:sugar O-acyltransferase (sialic acid O-acetyltransferase NeuD family)
MRKSLIVIGAGGHAKVVAEAARISGWTVLGFVDEVNDVSGQRDFFGARLWANVAVAISENDERAEWFVAIGDNVARAQKILQMQESGMSLATIIHPAAVVSKHSRVGPASFVAALAHLGPDSVVGDGVIINTAASVDHDCIVESFAHLSPRCVLGGHAYVGSRAWVGMGAVVRDRARIGADCVVGAASLVLREAAVGDVVVGIPAKSVRLHVR